MVYTLRRRLPLRFLALVSLFIVGGFLLAPGPRFAFPSFSSRVKGVSSLLYGSSIELLPSGLVKWSEGSGKHPIEELMLRGKAKWEGQLKRQSRTLQAAVNEYRRRYGRNPPKGFDEWWRFTQLHTVSIVDDYDQIDKDIRPYWAISPSDFRDRVHEAQDDWGAFVLNLSRTSPITVTGAISDSWRAKLLSSLLQPIAYVLPDDMSIAGVVHDLGSLLLGDDQRVFIEDKLARGQWASKEEIKPFEDQWRHPLKGLAACCPSDSPAWVDAEGKLGLQKPRTRPPFNANDTEHPNFIHSHTPTFDFCAHPSLLLSHGGLSTDSAKGSFLRPMLQMSKYLRNPELLATPLDAYTNYTGPNDKENPYLHWGRKTIGKVQWRGLSTGDLFMDREDFNWHNSHRIRLHALGEAGKDGSDEGLRVLVKEGRRWMEREYALGELSNAYLDVALVDGPRQCNEQDGTCAAMASQLKFGERMSSTEAAKYKFVIDVDGNGWSSRFHRLLLSGSVVLKSTIYPEFYSEWLTPWYHYIPLQVSYSELFNILSFFLGPPDRPKTKATGDERARQIAENGVRFAREHWRWEDMQSYMMRLLLEYIRLGRDDRDSWEYLGG